MTIQGIDVSNNNGDINWESVSNAGYDFAICKATQGISFVDRYLRHHWDALPVVGMLRGAYHFATPDQHSARSEAAHFVGTVLPLLGPGDVVALDLEQGTGDLSAWALDWLEAVALALGFKPWLYSSPSFIREHGLDDPALTSYGLWLASWGLSAMPAPVPPWQLLACWQSGVGPASTVPGARGECDLDVFNGSREQFKRYGLLPPT